MVRRPAPIQVYREAPECWIVACRVPNPQGWAGRTKASRTTWLSADDAWAWARQLLKGTAYR